MDTTVIYLAKQAIFLAVVICLPTIIVGSLAGFIFALFQTLTQVQDQTLSFAIKLISILVTIYFTLSWASQELYQFTIMLYQYKF